MKTVILCGGLGSRLSEETAIKPKPMVDVGGLPILWHIMMIYSHYDVRDFMLALGYKGDVIKNYFLDYHPLKSDITVDLATGRAEYSNNPGEDWKVSMVDTGQQTMTGGRLRRLENQLRDNGTFMLTYGDGVSNIDIQALLEFHRSHGKAATVTAVRPPARFGTMVFDGEQVVEFSEKPQTGEGWINGGFFVFEPTVFDYITDDATVLEEEPLSGLARDGQLMAYKHQGFWHCMDTLRDRNYLDSEWRAGTAQWKMWDAT